MVLVINLGRQPKRLRRTLRELSRFKTSDGDSLISLSLRLSAVDARDGRAVAATADVDQTYPLGHQLYVQPDARLKECFGSEQPVRMTRQEVAVARSHIEAWKVIAEGTCDHVLVLEDDVWFKRGAAEAIDRGWRAAVKRCEGKGGPHLLYLSYADAGGTAERTDICDDLFRPKRGLWFLSGYVLSREGARILLRSMPVVGPVDMWINFRFDALGALAISSPAILQRPDSGSDNCYSVLPYLARAGIVDSNAINLRGRPAAGPILAWTGGPDREGMAMALSMLGFRVRTFDGDEQEIQEDELPALFEQFDALVDAPLSVRAIFAAIAQVSSNFLIEAGATLPFKNEPNILPPSRTVILSNPEASKTSWEEVCALLGIAAPVEPFPIGPPREWRLFRDDRTTSARSGNSAATWSGLMDDTPWALLPRGAWPASPYPDQPAKSAATRLIHATMTTPTPHFPASVETFPGNLAAFALEGLVHGTNGAELILDKAPIGNRSYRSGSFASVRNFGHGRFEAEIKAALGPGLITGFFLHRDLPRQEIDVELTGDDSHRMLVNVYFNPGDDGAALAFGYRGSPYRVELGFDATLDFHQYAIEWRPGCISWLVDGRAVHNRVGWDPTPIPHLPMRLHANLWAPRSETLAGRIDDRALPATAIFRNVSIWT